MYSYFARLLGTFVGLIVGLLGWYIGTCIFYNMISPQKRSSVVGNAKSNGTPYGTAAVMAVFLVPMVFVRLFSPPQNLIAVMMFSVCDFDWMRNWK